MKQCAQGSAQKRQHQSCCLLEADNSLQATPFAGTTLLSCLSDATFVTGMPSPTKSFYRAAACNQRSCCMTMLLLHDHASAAPHRLQNIAQMLAETAALQTPKKTQQSAAIQTAAGQCSRARWAAVQDAYRAVPSCKRLQTIEGINISYQSRSYQKTASLAHPPLQTPANHRPTPAAVQSSDCRMNSCC